MEERRGKSDAFKEVELSPLVQEALAAALDDILREHTLSYIGYPEKATMKNKFMRVILGSVVLPLRLLSSFRIASLRTMHRLYLTFKKRIGSEKSVESQEPAERESDESESVN